MLLLILKWLMIMTGAMTWALILGVLGLYWTMCFIGWRYEKRRKKKEWNDDE